MNKHTSLKAMVLAAGLWLPASGAAAGDVSIRIDGFANDTGAARLVFVDSQDAFTGNRPVSATAVIPIENGKALWRGRLPAGDHAVIVHHDANTNDDLDRPLFGLPLEAYGFSNGATKVLGLPDWSQVRFRVGEGPVTHAVTVRHNPFAVGVLALKSGLPALVVVLAGLALVRILRSRAKTASPVK